MGAFTMTEKARPNLALKAEIVRRGWTQKRLALAVRIGETDLSQVIRGHKTAGPVLRAKIARTLDMPEVDLFPETREPVPA